MNSTDKPLSHAGDKVNEKVLKIRKEHHKDFKPLFRSEIYRTFLSIGIMGLGVWGAFTYEWWAYVIGFVALVLVGFCSIGITLERIFALGQKDDRSYFLKCIEVSEDEDELADMGFDQCGHIEEIIFERLLKEDPAIVRENPYIVELHQKHDLRRLADEIEKYEI